MIIARDRLNDGMVRFKTIERNIERIEKSKKAAEEKEDEMAKQEGNFAAAIIDLAITAAELKNEFGTYPYDWQSFFRQVKNVHDMFFADKITLDAAMMILKPVIEAAHPVEIYSGSVRPNSLAWNYQKNITTRPTFEVSVVEKIFSKFKLIKRPLNILDTNTLDGTILNKLNNIRPEGTQWRLYSVNPLSYGSVKKFCHKIANGAMSGAKISNEAFDVVFASPPCKVEVANGKFSFREDKMFLDKVMPYLRPGGLLVMSYPHFRFHHDVAVRLSRTLKSFEAYRGENGIVYFIGRAKERTDKTTMNTDVFEGIRKLWDLDSIVKVQEMTQDELDMPTDFIEVEQFRGGVVSMEEIEEIYKGSSALSQFWKAQHATFDYENKRPILPPTAGQLGIILASGVTNGRVDEVGKQCHLIKGRVVKHSVSSSDMQSDTERITNRVEINVLMPDGTHKILA